MSNLEKPATTICQDCNKSPAIFVTRKDRNSPTRYICGECSLKYIPTWGIVSFRASSRKEKAPEPVLQPKKIRKRRGKSQKVVTEDDWVEELCKELGR